MVRGASSHAGPANVSVLGVVGQQRLHFPAKRFVRGAGFVEKGGSRPGRKFDGSVEDVRNPLPAVVAHIVRQPGTSSITERISSRSRFADPTGIRASHELFSPARNLLSHASPS